MCLFQRLQDDRVSLTQRRDSFKQLLDEMNQKYEALKTKLQENETHAQVTFYTEHVLIVFSCLMLMFCLFTMSVSDFVDSLKVFENMRSTLHLSFTSILCKLGGANQMCFLCYLSITLYLCSPHSQIKVSQELNKVLAALNRRKENTGRNLRGSLREGSLSQDRQTCNRSCEWQRTSIQ